MSKFYDANKNLAYDIRDQLLAKKNGEQIKNVRHPEYVEIPASHVEKIIDTFFKKYDETTVLIFTHNILVRFPECLYYFYAHFSPESPLYSLSSNSEADSEKNEDSDYNNLIEAFVEFSAKIEWTRNGKIYGKLFIEKIIQHMKINNFTAKECAYFFKKFASDEYNFVFYSVKEMPELEMNYFIYENQVKYAMNKI